MPPPRPRGFGNSSGISGGRPTASTPMSERQQMALLMQMTSSASPSCSPDVTQQSNNHFATKSKDRNERGETNLHVAAIKGDQESVKKLLESGVSPNVTDFAGWSPLHEACSHGHYNIAFALIKAGANVNAKGLDDDTPLHDAAVGGNLKLVKFLLEKGADIFAKNRKGKTAVDVASSNILSYMCSIRDQTRNNDERDETIGSCCENNDEVGNHTLKKVSKDSLTNEDEKGDSRNKTDKQLTSSRVDELYIEEDSASKLTSPNLNIQLKRPNSDVELDETIDIDESKRKKRKDSENIRDTSKSLLNAKIPTRHEKQLKQTTVLTKTNTVTKSNAEKRSPCVSPKLTQSKGNDSDLETDEGKLLENITVGGPKVPPLKIVIPQQNSTNDIECGSRNGKTSSARGHAALPYVVSSSNSNDSTTAEKDVNTSRCNSPMETLHKTNLVSNASILHEEKNSKLNSEEKGQQRILRSSHRSGGQNIDRSSNNSSPQLQSNCPSPTAVSEANEKNVTLVSNTCTISPQLQVHSSENEPGSIPSPSASSTSSIREVNQSNSVELHPRKRKIRAKQEESFVKTSVTIGSDTSSSTNEIHPHDHPFTNCYHMYLNIRKQIERKHRNLYPIQPRPPQGFSDYLMNRRSYLLANNNAPDFIVNVPPELPPQMVELFSSQEQERFKLKLRHIVEKEKLGLAVEQEILRVHGKAARSLACQSVPFSACTLLKDEEVYNLITPEQEEKDRNARSRYNGRLFLSWLQDVDDKWEKIKEAMILRHHNEAESLHAKQQMDWEEILKDNNLCDDKSQPFIQESFVPMVHVSDDFDLLPA